MLNFSNLDVPPPQHWQQFEHLCWRLWQLLWNDPEAQKNGRQGQPQYGVDIIGSLQGKTHRGVQCKGKDGLTSKKVSREELKREVEKAKKFTPKLSSFILATTAPRDAAIQQYARKLTLDHKRKGLFSVQVYSWEDIRDHLSAFPDLVEELYPRSTFGRSSKSAEDGYNKLRQAVEQGFKTSNALLTVDIIVERYARGGNLSELQLPGVTAKQITDIACILQGRQSLHRAQPSAKRKLVLSYEDNRALSLLSVSPLPFSVKVLTRLFPDIAWSRQVREFRRHDLIKEIVAGYYEVTPIIKKTVVGPEAVRLEFAQKWIDVLRPLSAHPDTALMLTALLISTGKVADGIKVLIEASEYSVKSSWNNTYLSLLLTASKPKVMRLLKPNVRVRYLNAVGTNLTQASRHDEAIKWFKKLKDYSRRVGNSWGTRQFYHNCGIALFEMGKVREAEKYFHHATLLSGRAKDHFLKARSLFELAQCVVSQSPSEAMRLLDQSERLKTKHGNKSELIAIHHGRATICLAEGRPKDARRWYAKAAKVAEGVGDFHSHAQAEYNIGRCDLDIGKSKEALVQFVKAKKLAKKDELTDVLLLASGGEALALVALNRYRRAETAFRQLFLLQKASQDHVSAAISLHDVGVCLIKQRKYDSARKILSQAAKLARSAGDAEWTYKSQADFCRSYQMQGEEAKALQSLRRYAAAETIHKDFDVAAKLLSDLVETLVARDATLPQVNSAVTACYRSARKSMNPSQIIAKVLTTLYRWHWKNARYEAGIDSLEQLRVLATKSKEKELASQVQDQIGVCLQELGRYEEAVSAHRKALTIARRICNDECIETSLNNLGEALRHTNKIKEAIACLDEAVQHAQACQDVGAVVLPMHNLGLAYEYQGDFSTAEACFRRCLAMSRKLPDRHEYVRSLHAIANLSWHRKRPKIAIRRYSEALKAADESEDASRHQICLNYANALAWSGNVKLAAKILLSAEKQFATVPDAYYYYSQLASHYGAISSKQLAQRAWEASAAKAQQASNDDALALASGALGELHDNQGRFAEADKCYIVALSKESDPDLRLHLLLQRLNVLLHLRREIQAIKVLHELQEISTKQKSTAELKEALMMLGFYYWTDGDNPTKAVRFQVAAAGVCDEGELSEYFEICGSITASFWKRSSEFTVNKVSKCRLSTKRWIEKELGKALPVQKELVLLWPFDAAARVIKEVKEGRKVTFSRFTAIVEQEAERLIT